MWQLIWNTENGTLTGAATAVLGWTLVIICLLLAARLRRSERADRPAPYWMIRHEHRLKHLFGEPHDCLEVLSDGRAGWWTGR